MYYNKSFSNTRSSSNDQTTDEPKRQIRVRCYTCKVNQRGRDGICKNLTNNTCPHGYQK